MFGSQKILRKKNVKENNFLIDNLIKIERKSNINKITKKLSVLKLVNIYIDEFN